MNKLNIDLINKYKDIDPVILKTYKLSARKIIYNQDKKMFPITYKLPVCPEYNKIEGFGLPAEEQKWKPPTLPEKLRKLVSSCDTINEIWEKLNNNRDYFKDEIIFIKKQWYYRLNGKWVFINGVPTYLNKWHWFYLSWWHIDIGKPFYLSRDWKFFHFAEFCYNDTIAYYPYRIFYKKRYNYFATEEIAYKFKNNYNCSKIEKGNYYVDMKKRICFGFNYPKYRREGATYKAQCIGFEIGSRSKNSKVGIQSNNKDNAKEKYLDSTLYPFKKLPFFFTPNYDGSTNSQSGLTFDIPGRRITQKGSLANIEVGLNTRIDFAIADSLGYDGQKLIYHHHDEVGKFSSDLDLVSISNVVKECLSLNMGNDIIGLSIKTSTVGDTEPGAGGDRFKRYCQLSDYSKRNANGQTVSGNYNLFIPTEDGIIVDQFGNSVINDPKEDEVILNKDGYEITIGGRSYIRNRREGYLNNDNFDGLAQDKRQFPNSWDECFTVSSVNSFFPVGKMELRINELSFDNPTKIPGNFYWTDGFGSRVEFSPDPLGKWFMSIRLNKDLSNRKYWDREKNSWVPLNTHLFIAGSDPFNFNKPSQSKQSKGAGTVFYKHDPSVDPSENWEDWKHSNRIVCTYNNRSYDKDAYAEDMLKMILYFGCKINPEISNDHLWDYLEVKHNYSEFLHYMLDIKTLRLNTSPGAKPGNNTLKQNIFNLFSTHMDRFVRNEVHDEIIKEGLEIKSMDEMRFYDGFTSFGYCLLASDPIYNEIEEIKKIDMNINDYFINYSNQ